MVFCCSSKQNIHLSDYDGPSYEAGSKLIISQNRKDVANGIALLENVANQGHSRAALLLGDLFSEKVTSQTIANVIKPDYKKAKKYYKQANKKRINPDALYGLGLLYESGKLGKVEIIKAGHYFKSASLICDNYAQRKNRTSKINNLKAIQLKWEQFPDDLKAKVTLYSANKSGQKLEDLRSMAFAENSKSQKEEKKESD